LNTTSKSVPPTHHQHPEDDDNDKKRKCGNGHLDHGEHCDPGHHHHSAETFFYKCTSHCQKEPKVGHILFIAGIIIVGVICCVSILANAMLRRNRAAAVEKVRRAAGSSKQK